MCHPERAHQWQRRQPPQRQQPQQLVASLAGQAPKLGVRCTASALLLPTAGRLGNRLLVQQRAGLTRMLMKWCHQSLRQGARVSQEAFQ